MRGFLLAKNKQMQLLQQKRFTKINEHHSLGASCVHSTMQPAGIPVSNDENIDIPIQPEGMHT